MSAVAVIKAVRYSRSGAGWTGDWYSDEGRLYNDAWKRPHSSAAKSYKARNQNRAPTWTDTEISAPNSTTRNLQQKQQQQQ